MKYLKAGVNMCGIVGAIGQPEAASILYQGLQRLEYRGYDSAGVCTFDHGMLNRRRAVGKLAELGKVLAEQPLSGSAGIGHTRGPPMAALPLKMPILLCLEKISRLSITALLKIINQLKLIWWLKVISLQVKLIQKY